MLSIVANPPFGVFVPAVRSRDVLGSDKNAPAAPYAGAPAVPLSEIQCCRSH